jgi:hypothetical protein
MALLIAGPQSRTSQTVGQARAKCPEWFATVEIERMSQNPDWLDKAIRIVEKQIHEMNQKQRGKEPAELPVIQ